jgi:hypothetical protein
MALHAAVNCAISQKAAQTVEALSGAAGVSVDVAGFIPAGAHWLRLYEPGNAAPRFERGWDRIAARSMRRAPSPGVHLGGDEGSLQHSPKCRGRAIQAFSYEMLMSRFWQRPHIWITNINGVRHDHHSYYRSTCCNIRGRRFLWSRSLVVIRLK